ncbi:SLATT domain-containing protein [Aquabacterium sp. OR-4]|uniref:SLATT domain-containing protein n=1 Tax=Aquabacterium sp. OR-4 TaxID=2978127 RepID=UPI0028C90508|nr:SLATT domain-containing protein [Aquabacterium sp. OR-4]MDT7838762.1 SLATT domain-containing protein [Aquabacterium sp. OR-4]
MAHAKTIARPDGSTLTVWPAPAGAPATAAAQALGLASGGPVVWVAGGDDALPQALQARITQLLARGLLRPLREHVGTPPLLLVRAQGSGLPALLGRSVADGAGVRLLGVAPQALIELPADAAAGAAALPAGTGPRLMPVPGLSDLLLTPGSAWGDELGQAVALASQVAAGPRVLLLLIGGGPAALPQVLAAVRQGWPVLLVQGSGGLADALLAQAGRGAADGDDPAVAEILADGKLDSITLGDKVAEAVDALARRVRRDTGGDSVLRQAWQRFAIFDQAAAQQQTGFNRMQRGILVLGVAVVALSVGRKQWLAHLDERARKIAEAASTISDKAASAAQALAQAGTEAASAAAGVASSAAVAAASAAQAASAAVQPGAKNGFDSALFFLLVALPITVSALVALDIRFSPGKRWLLLRAAAEGIKREIYRYRAMPHPGAAPGEPEKALAKAVEDITRRLARTEANALAMPAYAGEVPPPGAVASGDDGLSPLGPERYLHLRLRAQCDWYRRKTVAFHAKASWCQVAVIVVGAVGSLLTALSGSFGDGMADWVAVTAAVSSALLAFLGFKQFEKTLVGYNQTATDLENLQAWWTALTHEEQADTDNIAKLVNHTEKALGDEQDSWAQSMTNALEDLRKGQDPGSAARGAGGGGGDGAGGGSAGGGGGGGGGAAAEAGAGAARPGAVVVVGAGLVGATDGLADANIHADISADLGAATGADTGAADLPPGAQPQDAPAPDADPASGQDPAKPGT